MTQSMAPVAAKGHPKGLYLLFSTEMWERMSYYGMRALLVLYIKGAVDHGGLGWSREKALLVLGVYALLVYLTPAVGGYLADRYLGQRLSVKLGGLLMMLGQFALAVPGSEAFLYTGLGLLVLGNGLFKPNISAMVSRLYAPGDARRDGAFTIFYIGVNVGAFLGSFICGTLGEKFGWPYGFGSAGVGMGLGVVLIMLLGDRFLGDVGKQPSMVQEALARPDQSAVALTHEEKDRIKAIILLAIFVVFFWLAFEQAGGLMNIYTDDKVDRHVLGWEVPTTWFQAINPVFIMTLGPLFTELWLALGRRQKEPTVPVKMSMGLLLVAFGFVFMMGASKQSEMQGKAALSWVVAAYFFHTAGELCLSPVGLSMVTKLAPARFTSLLIGVWYIANGVANLLAAIIGTFAKQLGEFTLFTAIAVEACVAGVVLLMLAPRIKRMMHGADENRPIAVQSDAPPSADPRAA